jgi:hypothetical protein
MKSADDLYSWLLERNDALARFGSPLASPLQRPVPRRGATLTWVAGDQHPGR